VGLLIDPPSTEFIRGKEVEIISDESKFMDGEEIAMSDTSNVTEIDRKNLIGEKYHDRGKLPDEFNKIEVGLRIIPSQNDEGGIIFLPLVFESGEHDSYITKRVNTSAGFFLFDKTQDYFP